MNALAAYRSWFMHACVPQWQLRMLHSMFAAVPKLELFLPMCRALVHVLWLSAALACGSRLTNHARPKPAKAAYTLNAI